MKNKTTVLPNLCQFPFNDGRSCRMPRSPNHDYLCLFHADRERRLFDQQALDAGDLSDLFGPTGELRTSTEVNAYLTRIAKHAVAGHISPEILPSVVYAASLLLQPLPGVRNDTTISLGVDHWLAELRRLHSLRNQPRPTSAQPVPEQQ